MWFNHMLKSSSWKKHLCEKRNMRLKQDVECGACNEWKIIHFLGFSESKLLFYSSINISINIFEIIEGCK